MVFRQAAFSSFIIVIAFMVQSAAAQQLDDAAKNQIIDNMVEGASAIKAEPPLKSVNVRRDGLNDGVIYEYTYLEGVDVNEKDLSSRKIVMRMLDKTAFGASTWDEFGTIYGADIYSRFVYKYADGRVITDTTIDKKVFEEFLEEADELHEIVDNMIAGGKSEMESNDYGGIFHDVDVRRLPGFGVVFEYVYADGVTVDESMLAPERVREQIIEAYRGDSNSWDELVEITDKGIFMKFVYKYFDGKVISETNVEGYHLEDFQP